MKIFTRNAANQLRMACFELVQRIENIQMAN